MSKVVYEHDGIAKMNAVDAAVLSGVLVLADQVPDELLTMDNGAYASFEERIKGSIEPGKLADLVVLGEDLTRVPGNRIRDTAVQMTVVGGEVTNPSGNPSTPSNRKIRTGRT